MAKIIPRDQITEHPDQIEHYVHDETEAACFFVTPLVPNAILDTGDEEVTFGYIAKHIRVAKCLQCHDRGEILTTHLPAYAEFISKPAIVNCTCQTGKDLTERQYNENRLSEIDMAAEEAGW